MEPFATTEHQYVPSRVTLKSRKTRYEWERKEEFPRTKACLPGAQGRTSWPWGSVHTTWRRWGFSLASPKQYTKALARKGRQTVEQFLMTASPLEVDAMWGGKVEGVEEVVSARTKAWRARIPLVIAVRVEDEVGKK